MFNLAMSPPVIGSLLLGLVALLALLRRRRELTGATLVAPWYWATGALVFIALVSSSNSESVATSHLRYLAGASTFCPLMALLGAKRPQDRAWQFVVFTLLVVLALPSAEAILYQPDTPLRVHPAWGLLLWTLVVIGLFNTLPTRHWRAGLVAAAGQIVLLAGQLPGIDFVDQPHNLLLAFVLLSLSVIAWGFDLPRPRTVPTAQWDLVWRDFRDSFGSLWALRVADRFNAAAETHDWNAKLGWHGFYTVSPLAEKSPHEPGSPLLSSAMEINLRGLLRRFVSDEWITERVHCSPPAPDLD